MGIRSNTLANFAGTGFAMAAALFVVPLYLSYLDADGYGLVGFFFLAQSWLALMDLGFSQVVLRSAAILKRNDDSEAFLRFFKSLEKVFMALGVMVALLAFSCADLIRSHWLSTSSLDGTALRHCLQLMGFTIALRLTTSFYRSCLQGLELQLRLNVLNVLGSALRYPGALLLLHFFGADYLDFFLYQSGVAMLEMLLLGTATYRVLPKAPRGTGRFRLGEITAAMPFATSVAYTSFLSLLLSQVDRLMFSTALPLAEFGYLATVTLIASALVQLGGPVSAALLPRLTALYAGSEEASFRRAYLGGAEVLALLLAPAALIAMLFPYPLLLAWTGSWELAAFGAKALFYYGLGNLMMAFCQGAFFLQYVRGDLKLHTRYLTVMAIVQTPILAYLALRGSVLTVAQLWCLFRAVDLFLWSYYIHRRLAPGLYLPWVVRSLRPVCCVFLVLFPAALILEPIEDLPRITAFAVLAGLALFAAIVAVLFSPLGREQLRLLAGMGERNA